MWETPLWAIWLTPLSTFLFFPSPSFLIIVWTVPRSCASAQICVSREPNGGVNHRERPQWEWQKTKEHGRQKWHEGGEHVQGGGKRKLKTPPLPSRMFQRIHWTDVLKLLIAVSTVIFANDVPIIHVIAVWGVRCLQITAVIIVLHVLTCSALTVFCSPLLAALVGLEKWDYRKRKVLAAQLYAPQPRFLWLLLTSMGFTMMVRAESSQNKSPSLLPVPVCPSAAAPGTSCPIPCRCSEWMRRMPRITKSARKPTHTTMMIVAALGTTSEKKRKRRTCGYGLSHERVSDLIQTHHAGMRIAGHNVGFGSR